MTGRDDQQLKTSLRQLGLRVTAPRLAVARCLATADSHLTADGVLARLRAKGCRCARATVYNVLNEFTRCGLVRTVVVEGGRTYFDPVTEPHPHLYRQDTGELIDLPARALPDPDTLGLPPGLEVERISLVVHASPGGGRG